MTSIIHRIGDSAEPGNGASAPVHEQVRSSDSHSGGGAPRSAPASALLTPSDVLRSLREVHANLGKDGDRHRAECPNDLSGAAIIAARRKGIGLAINLLQPVARAQEPAGKRQAKDMAGVAEQSGAGAPETSVRCGAPAAHPTEHALNASEEYLVWSNQHRAWWRPNSAGYARDVRAAGRYSRDEAIEISAQGRDGWHRLDQVPDELAIPISTLPKNVRETLTKSEGA